MTDAFSGVRILDFTQLEQGPSATQVLADFGADVIKIERVDRGEIGRFQPPFLDQGYSPHWSATNRNKEHQRRPQIRRGPRPDPRAGPRRRHRGEQLPARCDGSTRPGLGHLSAINPRIIVAYASGYGMTGPYTHRRGQDLAAQAISGLMALTGSAATGPVPIGTFIVDYLASMQFAQGMMIALAARERTGRGQVVDSNLLNAAITSHLQEGTTYLNTGQQYPRPNEGIAHAHNTALYGYYECADGLWLTLIGEFYVDEQWQRCARACGLPRTVSTTRASRPSTACARTPRKHTAAGRRHPRYQRDDIMARFEAEDVLVAPVHDYAAVFADPQVTHNGLVLEADVPGVGPVKFVGMPVQLSDTPPRLRVVSRPSDNTTTRSSLRPATTPSGSPNSSAPASSAPRPTASAPATPRWS